MIVSLKEIEQAFDKFLKDIDVQLAASNNDADKFHNSLIELIAKFPDDKELIQFIVSINDRLETNHIIAADILAETIKNTIKQNLVLVKRLLREYELRNAVEQTNPYIAFVKDNKAVTVIISVALAVMIVFSSLMVMPKETLETLTIINKTVASEVKK